MQVGVELVHLLRCQHSFVDKRPGGQAGDIKLFAAADAGGPQRMGRALADHKQLSLKMQRVGDIFAAPNKELTDDGPGGNRRLAERPAVGRHFAPAEKLLAFFGSNFCEFVFADFALAVVLRQKRGADAVQPGIRQFKSQFCTLTRKKSMGNLKKDARAVAGVRIRAARASVGEVAKDRQRLTDNLVRFFAFNVDDKSCAAGIMLEIGVIQPLLRGQANRFHAEAVPLLNQVGQSGANSWEWDRNCSIMAGAPSISRRGFFRRICSPQLRVE